MKTTKIWDAADGSATPGRVFTASIAQESIPALGTKLDYLKMGVKGAVSTAAVAVEDFAGLISPFTLRKGAGNRIVANLDELCALSRFYFPDSLAVGENTDNTGNDFLGDIRIPVYDNTDPAQQFLIQADRAVVTNVGTETVALTGYFDTGDTTHRPVHYVRIPQVTASAAGLSQLQPKIPAVGKLRGLIIKVPNGFADGNIDTSVQRVKIYDDTTTVVELNDLSDSVPLMSNMDYVTPSPMGDLLRQFRAFDFGPNGLDASQGTLSIGIDVQDVSDNIVILPILEIGTGA